MLRKNKGEIEKPKRKNDERKIRKIACIFLKYLFFYISLRNKILVFQYC